MDLRQLRYFLTVAQEGQVTSAAKRLNMEQPPLSRQLKLMEQELGVALFDRSGKRLKLTKAGELLRQRAEQLLLQFHETVKEVKELDEGIRGVLSIGSVVSCISLLPRRLEQFRNRYPGVIFKVREGDHFLLGELLERRSIELIVARLPFEATSRSSQPYSIERLPSDPFVAILPSSWCRDGSGQPSLSMRELAEYPFLTLKTDQTIGMHERVVKEFQQHGATPRILCECSSVAIIIAMVAAGIGATILPKSVMASFPIPSIRMVELTDADFYSDVGIVWLKDRYLSKSARRFIEMFLE
ncbi:LysR family transcriptional regulator [Paenibacillus thermoaerophilus]|uniref:LysR family transcriptional regulator n=1 Tax=Paenibacillus thermoaerophilus TaxID=1215385 RepID=A0ABW2V3Q3_9BACL|nr:LysR family transcriptional regulator [Paenibacillus thermoaerophilus]TMV18453.1 LysR family transcriptional regulator [Paenibacillus thermoaerophilus]